MLFVSVPLAADAFDTTLRFPDVKIDLPPSSLIEDALQRIPAIVSDFEHQLDFERQFESGAAQKIRFSRMPIISPKTGVDPKMAKEPNSSVEYNLIVKSPEMESAK